MEEEGGERADERAVVLASNEEDAAGSDEGAAELSLSPSSLGYFHELVYDTMASGSPCIHQIIEEDYALLRCFRSPVLHLEHMRGMWEPLSPEVRLTEGECLVCRWRAGIAP